ncbi:cytochrome c [Sulfitobacter sp. JBTF-M27]|uniref:Cytochrome c n=2 Tax=Sulfitobacter sediminilitoris TaxID=2698830 RepID=A0A6P0C7W7_9RHOB|nr:cytochrome c [Sulfitobacter sediminilitoris]
MNLFMKSTMALGLGVAVIATASIAGSHSSEKLNPAVAARQHQMQIVGYSIGILGAVAKGEMEYDAAMVSSAAKNLNALAQLDRASLWIEGTEQGATAGTRAKAEIWSDPDGFAEKFEALADASAALIDASDAAAVGAGMGDLGGSCKGCHEKYRGPKNE